MYGYIYKITNLINNKIYVGKAKDIKKRFAAHIRLAEQNDPQAIHKAILKYGKSNFSVIEIDCADSLSELNKKEIFWISELKSQDPSIGYNMTKGGDGGNTLATKSAAEKHLICQKMSASQRSRIAAMSADKKAIWIKKQSLAHKKQIPACKGKHYYNNGIYEKRLSDEEAIHYLINGWKRGGLKGKFSKESNEQRVLSRKKFYESHPEKYQQWCSNISKAKKGNTIITEQQRKQNSETLKKYYKEHPPTQLGRKHSIDERQKMSAKAKGRIWIYNPTLNTSKQVKQSELDKYLTVGWIKGRSHK